MSLFWGRRRGGGEERKGWRVGGPGRKERGGGN